MNFPPLCISYRAILALFTKCVFLSVFERQKKRQVQHDFREEDKDEGKEIKERQAGNIFWHHFIILNTAFIALGNMILFCGSGIKIEQNFLSSWTPPSEAIIDTSSGGQAHTQWKNSGNTSAFQENKTEVFWEDVYNNSQLVATEGSPSLMEWWRCHSAAVQVVSTLA